MIKLKMIELLNCFEVLKKIGNINTNIIPISFKFKIYLLMNDLKKYLESYNIQIQELINEYEIDILQDGRITCEDENKLKNFLSKKNELENMDLEIEYEKIMFDKNINNISANDLLNLSPFFDFSELMQ